MYGLRFFSIGGLSKGEVVQEVNYSDCYGKEIILTQGSGGCEAYGALWLSSEVSNAKASDVSPPERLLLRPQ